MYVIVLPFMEPLGYNFFLSFADNFLIQPIVTMTYFSQNGLSIYVIFNRNWNGFTDDFPKILFG